MESRTKRVFIADFAPAGAKAVVSVDHSYESSGRKSSNGGRQSPGRDRPDGADDGGWRSQEGEYAVQLKGDFGDTGTQGALALQGAVMPVPPG